MDRTRVLEQGPGRHGWPRRWAGTCRLAVYARTVKSREDGVLLCHPGWSAVGTQLTAASPPSFNQFSCLSLLTYLDSGAIVELEESWWVIIDISHLDSDVCVLMQWRLPAVCGSELQGIARGLLQNAHWRLAMKWLSLLLPPESSLTFSEK
ncbi:hypothetical protein AAY473_021920 [Plecturocebus cupreus]